MLYIVPVVHLLNLKLHWFALQLECWGKLPGGKLKITQVVFSSIIIKKKSEFDKNDQTAVKLI